MHFFQLTLLRKATRLLILFILFSILGFSNKSKRNKSLSYSNNQNEKTSLSISFCESYPDACSSFKKTYINNLSVYKHIIKDQWKLDVTKVIAIVSPEIAMYSSGIDKIETLASEIFYIQFGEDYANFSLGIFQMKPSFIRNLESAIKKEINTINPPLDISINQKNEEYDRKVRINRIKNSEWQLHYICAFYKLMEYKTKDILFESENERIAYYAAAYNSGFNKPFDEIKKIRYAKLFPKKIPGRQSYFSYADVSLYFMNHIIIQH